MCRKVEQSPMFFQHTLHLFDISVETYVMLGQVSEEDSLTGCS